MHTATVTLKSAVGSSYSQGRHYSHSVPVLNKERPDDYETRTWRNRMHVTDDGRVFIPPMAFKNCLSEAAKFLGIQIPGKGKATFTKNFEAGVMVVDPLVLDIKAKDVEANWLFVPASGRRGDGKRVMRCFPLIKQWGGVVTFHIVDDTITQEIFEQHLIEAGKLIGIGVFRPRNNGYFGRFTVEKVSWK
ncbi:MAG: hypothetical protein ABIF19_17065 [Planctomycetota bacterium]